MHTVSPDQESIEHMGTMAMEQSKKHQPVIWTKMERNCHNLFPELSPLLCSHIASTGLTPILSSRTSLAMPTSPDHAQLSSISIVIPCHIPGHGQDPHKNEIPTSQGCWALSSVMWPSCDNHKPSFLYIYFHLIEC